MTPVSFELSEYNCSKPLGFHVIGINILDLILLTSTLTIQLNNIKLWIEIRTGNKIIKNPLQKKLHIAETSESERILANSSWRKS